MTMIETWRETVIREGWEMGRPFADIAAEAGMTLADLETARRELMLGDRDVAMRILPGVAMPVEGQRLAPMVGAQALAEAEAEITIARATRGERRAASAAG